MKKSLALILSTILLLTSFGMTAFAMDLSSPIVSGNGYLSIGYFAGDSVKIVDNLQPETKRYTDETSDYSKLGDAAELEADPTLAQVAKDLLGATYIQPSHNVDAANETYWRGKTKWIEFTLTHSATVYYMTADRRAATPNPWLANDGWQWYTKEGIGTAPADDNPAWFVNSTGWIQGRMFLLKKDIVASPEKPVTITAIGGV